MSLYTYRANVVKVVDGDTVDLNIDLGLNTFRVIRCRLYGIDSPETYGVKKDSEEYQAGMKAKMWLESQLEDVGSSLIVKTHKDATGKYGRYLVELFKDADSTDSINTVMLDLKLARPYLP